MKLLWIIADVFIISLFSMVFMNGYGKVKKLSDELKKSRESYEGQKFIYESFRKTCEGKCFDSFLEWQKYCKDNWKLDYIGFSEAEEFCNDYKMHSNGQVLMYGKWNGPFGEGEVYCIKD